MAHFSELDDNSVVLRVVVVHNNELLVNGKESEEKGIAFCKSLFGEDTRWKQCSYNKTFRKNFGGPGYKYDEELDAFIEPKPYPSWTLNTSTCQWEAPIQRPQDDNLYFWQEEAQSWVQE